MLTIALKLAEAAGEILLWPGTARDIRYGWAIAIGHMHHGSRHPSLRRAVRLRVLIPCAGDKQMNKPLVGILLAGIAGGYFVGLYLAPVGDEGRMTGMVVGLLAGIAVYLYLRAPGA